MLKPLEYLLYPITDNRQQTTDNRQQTTDNRQQTTDNSQQPTANSQQPNLTMNKTHKKYWKENLKYLAILLSIWFVVSFGFGILLVDELNTIKLGGFKLGFWFAQQGAIYVFVILIFLYIRLMNKLDKKYDLDH